MAQTLQVPVDDFTYQTFQQQANATGLSVTAYLRKLAERQSQRRYLDVYPAELSPEAKGQLDEEYNEIVEDLKSGSEKSGAVQVGSVQEMMEVLEND